MPDRFIYKQRDFDNDLVQNMIFINEGLAITDSGTFKGLLDAWFAGANGGTFHQLTVAADGGTPATSPVAQPSVRAVFEFTDDVTNKTVYEYVAMPDLSKAADGSTNEAFIRSGNLTVFNPAHADYIALKAWLDANGESEAGNAVTLQRIYIEE